ncbi:transposase [Mesorhizobium cantuariense]|uniref:Transposase n=1 Tax=Mesorhizobium cantuariense TaxID=1300275 RepID=A0ABV7MFH3_9HYPH
MRTLMAVARANPTARLFMTVPGVGVITALSVASSFDDASRFSRSSSAGAYLGLTPRRYVSGFKKARIAVARKMAVILHAMWKTNTPFRWSQEEAA